MSPTMMAVYVFVLSCVIGYHVIWGITPALHTPLMAVTNAISAIVVIGAIWLTGTGPTLPIEEGSIGIPVIGFFSIFFASINIFGGFVVTNRMLAMFKKKKTNRGSVER